MEMPILPAKSPKIVVVGPSAPPLGAGGVGSSHYNLWRCFRDRGLDAYLLTFNERGEGAEDDRLQRFGATERQRALLALGSTVYLKALGSRKLAYQLVDILHSIPGVLRMNRALRRLKPDHIIIPDHCGPGLFLDKGAARLTLVAHHNPSRFTDNSLLGDFCPIDVRQALALEQRILRKVDAVITPSRYMEGVFRDTFSFDGPVATIHNPLDPVCLGQVAARNLRAELGLAPGAPLVYIPSAGSRFKGERFVAEIIGKLAVLHRAEIGFYLSGTLTAELIEELRCVPGNVRIHAPGHLGYRDNLALVKACNFGISPTLIENFSMAILEAGFCGLPMVVFRVGGTGEMISDGVNGFCVPCADVEGLIAASVRVLDTRYCQELGNAAAAFARTHFATDTIINRYLEFCKIAVPATKEAPVCEVDR